VASGYQLRVTATTDTDTDGPIDHAVEWAKEQQEEYAGDEDRPLGGYVLTTSIYLASVAAGALALKRSRHRLPERIAARDLALLAVASHKVARMVAKDSVTSPLRAPVTRYTGPSGPAELAEEVRGTGAKHAFGELITCPFCLSQWVATAGIFGLVAAPRTTRAIASTFAVVAGADFLQLAYGAAQRLAR
jgi:hypothetical protein